jgi:hypothetical protein
MILFSFKLWLTGEFVWVNPPKSNEIKVQDDFLALLEGVEHHGYHRDIIHKSVKQEFQAAW